MPADPEDLAPASASDLPAEGAIDDPYFDTMALLQEAVKKRDYTAAATLVRENLRHLPALIQEWSGDYGSFDIRSIPGLEQGGTVLALVGDDEGLQRMRELVLAAPELSPWFRFVERHEKDRNLFPAIIEAVHEHSGCLQSEIKGLVGEPDGRTVARLISYLEKAGKLARVKSGRTYKLLPPNSPGVPRQSRRVVRSHRAERVSSPPQVLGVSSLDCVPLPRAPFRWEEVQAGRARAGIPKPVEPFAIRDADWQVVDIETIPPAQRPDTAFRRLHATDSGLIAIDDLGNAEGLGHIEAAALRYDRSGRVAVTKALDHGIYRLGVHPMGEGLIAMSKDCVLHAYNDDLDPILETTLADAPEITALRDRFDIPAPDQLKNHLRSVALSRNATRYIFTAVDEAWCVDVHGHALWGVQLPPREGWERAVPAGEDYARGTVSGVAESSQIGAKVTVSVGIEDDESEAADWIYAASFAAQSDDAYLGGHSGRVVKVDGTGRELLVYDIGSVPERIVDTGRYLYLLTDTRLYVLRQETLHALVDVFDGGELLVAQTGFGLLEPNRLRWFREDGLLLGSVVSKEPIRRVYHQKTGLVVETRQRRATVQGVRAWWN